jgi:hypothetical protein
MFSKYSVLIINCVEADISGPQEAVVSPPKVIMIVFYRGDPGFGLSLNALLLSSNYYYEKCV